MKNSKNLLSKAKLMLSLAVLLVTSNSCNKDSVEVKPSQGTLNQQVTAEQGAVLQLAAIASNSNLIIEETLEGSNPFSTVHSIENCGLPYALGYVAPAFQGLKSARFEIRKGQPPVGSSDKIRSEATIIKGTEDNRFTANIWYSFAIYFPSVGFENDDTREVITQWYEDGSDETSLRCEENKAYLEVCPPSGSSTLKTYDLFQTGSALPGGPVTSTIDNYVPIPKDTWHEFVFHFIHSTGSGGLIEVWRNGVKIHNIAGRNMHVELPKWKLGLYKSSFRDGSSKRSSRVVYFDNIRVGKAAATFADMTSGTTPPPTTPPPTTPPPTTPPPTTPPPTTPPPTTPPPTTPPPTTPPPASTQKVTTYTLINAGTNRDIMTINNGARISLRSIDNPSRLAIRANTSPSNVNAITMSLSGADRKTTIEDTAPFALFGDDGKGRYTPWTPVLGAYTLKATCYAGSKNNLGAATGPEYTINFTLLK